MNINYRLNQLKNSFSRPKSNDHLNWVFIYGLPRSGTTFLLNAFLQKARLGIGDWDLSAFQVAIDSYKTKDYVDLNFDELVEDIRTNILRNAPPGGGSEFDLIVKQINTNRKEYDFLVRLFGCEAQEKIFCYREPNGWLPSAMKKFDLKEKEAQELYIKCLSSYDDIGGFKVDYQDLPFNGDLKKFDLNFNGFIHSETTQFITTLQDNYKAFKKTPLIV